MSKYILKLIIAFIVLCLFSCQKDNEGFRTTPNGGDTSYESDITGFVINEDNDPILGASVSFNGDVVQTDEFGYYQFKNVLVDSRHNFINITKDGYFEGTKVFRTRSQSSLSFRTQLLEKNFNHSFSTTSGGTIQEENVTIGFTPGSVVYDGTSNSYDGEVKLAVRYLDPTDENLFLYMPGDMSGVDENNVLQTLTSYGMAYVEMETPSGEALQLKETHPAEMKMIVDDALLSNAPATIPLWHFDETSGLWKKEGTADLQGNTYVGKVSHFSCWNYDSNLPSIILSGRLVDTNGAALPYLHIRVTVEGVSGQGQGWSNPDGTFAGAVAKDEPLIISITSFNLCGEEIYSDEIGPFSQDTDIGDIVLDLESNANLTHVTAEFVDCNNNPVSNGVVSIGGTFYTMLNSSINMSFLTCDPSVMYNVIGYDLDSHLQSVDVPLTNVPGDNNLGLITVCDSESYYLEINSDDPFLDVTCSFELGADEFGGVDRIMGYANDPNNPDSFIAIRIEYNDNLTEGFAEGTFAMATATIEDGDLSVYQLQVGTVTVTDYILGTEDFIKGYYSMTGVHVATGVERDFEGTFKLRTFF